MKTSNNTIFSGAAGKLQVLLFVLSLCVTHQATLAQTLYVDAVKGKTDATGTADDPIQSLEAAVWKSNTFSGKEPVHIRIFPGLYTLAGKLSIHTAGAPADTSAYTIEAVYMPDDTAWRPLKMPVVQSVSGNNTTNQFPHSAGIFVEKSNVTIKGIKFLGNANPEVTYYYPIRRDDKTVKGLQVSQCYFVGNAGAAPIQSAFWLVNGWDVKVDHCIVYNCKNSFVLRAIDGVSITNSIISGSYEAVIWNVGTNANFVFKNNVVTNSAFLMVHAENGQPAYTLTDSYIVGNENYLGTYAKGMKLTPVKNTAIKEQNVRKTGKIQLVPVKSDGMPRDYFNLAPGSDGADSGAGVFKTRR